MKYILPCDLHIKEPIIILDGSVIISEEPGLYFRDLGSSVGYTYAVSIEVSDSLDETIRKEYLRMAVIGISGFHYNLNTIEYYRRTILKQSANLATFETNPFFGATVEAPIYNDEWMMNNPHYMYKITERVHIRFYTPIYDDLSSFMCDLFKSKKRNEILSSLETIVIARHSALTMRCFGDNTSLIIQQLIGIIDSALPDQYKTRKCKCGNKFETRMSLMEKIETFFLQINLDQEDKEYYLSLIKGFKLIRDDYTNELKKYSHEEESNKYMSKYKTDTFDPQELKERGVIELIGNQQLELIAKFILFKTKMING